MSKGRKRLWVILALLAGVVLVCCGAWLGIVALLEGRGGTGIPLGNGIAVIEIEGVIAERSVYTPAGFSAGSGDIIENLRSAERDANVKAIVLYIDSPGGSVVASDEIYRVVKEAQKPVVAYLGDIAASGAYYIACGADKIVAHPASLTGSIGVIVEVPHVEDLMKKLGIEVTVIKSGPFKDEGSYFREMTEEEKAYWQEMIDKVHRMFVEVVAQGRNLPVEEVEKLANGRVYLGQDALELGLVDELGTFDDALALAAEMGGISGRYRIIRYRKAPGLLDLLFSSVAQKPWDLLEGILPLGRAPALLYIYR